MRSDDTPATDDGETIEIRRIVVDASVAAKWHLQDEEYVAQALSLLDDFAAGRIEVLAPAQIRYGIPSAITVATRGRMPRLTFEQGQQAIDEFLALGVCTIAEEVLIRAAYPLVHLHEIAYYDALYLACAQHVRCSLVTADRRLYQRIQTLPAVIWIEDYPTPAS